MTGSTRTRVPIINLPSLARRQIVAHNGNGTVESARALVDHDFETSLAFVEYVELRPGASIGLHRHGDDEELYFVISGRGRMTIEETTHRVRKGDLILNPRNGAHGLENDSVEVIKLLVWQVQYRGES